MLLEFISGNPVCDRDDMESCMPGTGNVVRRITDYDSPARIDCGAVPSGEPFGDDGRKRKPVTRVITERADTQVQVSVQTGYTKLDFRCDTQISGQHRLNEPMLVQRGNGIDRARIRWLIPGKFGLPLGHDIGQNRMKPLDAALSDFRLNPRSDRRIHHDRLVGVTVHTSLREDNGLFRKAVRAGDSPTEPT